MTTVRELSEAGLLKPGVDIGALTTYRLGGAATWFGEPETVEVLAEIVAAARTQGLSLLIIGRGSNVVVSDSGYDGVVLRLGAGFRQMSIDFEGVVTAGASLALPQLARSAAQQGFGGVEFYVGVPGSVGGAVAMNAGCFGSETADVLVDATVMDLRSGEISVLTNKDLAFGYRYSALTTGLAVLSARFAAVPVDSGEALATIREVTRWRKDHQPGGTHNAGSVFKNPPGDHAGRLVDSLGMKGLGVGDVSVSHKHANFFVAGPNARAQDLYELVHIVKAEVEAKAGVVLEPEIRFIGEFTRGDA